MGEEALTGIQPLTENSTGGVRAWVIVVVVVVVECYLFLYIYIYIYILLLYRLSARLRISPAKLHVPSKVPLLPLYFWWRQNMSLCFACFPVALPALQTLRFPILQRLLVRNATYFKRILKILIWAFQNVAPVHVLAIYFAWRQHVMKTATCQD